MDFNGLLSMSGATALTNLPLLERIAETHVKKPTLTTHFKRSMTGLELRLLTALIFHAQKKGPVANGIYEITLATLKKMLNYKSNNNEHIYEALRKLKANDIEWNILKQDRKSKEVLCAFLITLIVDKNARSGMVGYQFHPDLEPVILKPLVYGRHKILMLSLLAKPKHAFTLYELLADAYSRKEYEFRIELSDLHRILATDPDKIYARSFKEFKKGILVPALEMINSKSNLNVSYSTIKPGRRIEALVFKISEDAAWLEKINVEGLSEQLSTLEQYGASVFQKKPGAGRLEYSDPVLKDLVKRGVNDRTVERAAKKYGIIGVKEIVNYYDGLIESDKRYNSINDPIAYLATCLNSGYGVLSEEQRQKAVEAQEYFGASNRKKALTSQVERIMERAKSMHKEASVKYLDNMSSAEKEEWKEEFLGLVEEAATDRFVNLKKTLEFSGWNSSFDTIFEMWIAERFVPRPVEYLDQGLSEAGIDGAKIRKDLPDLFLKF